jgi:D-threonate/D-erythronate kinase
MSREAPVIVRIVADDLTGALDTAAPFAAAGEPLPVFWDGTRRSGSYAFDSETRERPDDAFGWAPHLHGADLAFKKIDSLLRGRAADEIVACLRGGRFRSAIIAPAFPAQARVTRLGRQYWRPPGQAAWQPVEVDLLLELRRSLPVVHAKSARTLASTGFFLCDAESEADLAAIVAAGRGMAGPLLWCGSAGLACALAGPPKAQQAFVPDAPLLMLIGSAHPVSRTQHEALRNHSPELVTPLRPGAIEEAVAAVAAAIGQGRSAALALDLPAAAPEEARRVLAETYALIAAQMPRPGGLLVTGGETLYGLLQALHAASLLATGELLPGVPHARLVGGRWHDLPLIAKSGGFGAPDLLIRLAESVMP